MGGSKDPVSESACNYLMLCRTCHLVGVELNRQDSLAKGWLVRQGHDPSSVAVKLWDGWFYLTPDGERVEVIGTVPAAWRGHLGRERGGS